MTNSPLSPQEAARELLARRNARGSLLGFTQYTMPKFQPGSHHARIAAGLEAVERGEIRRLMIEAPPRHTKSELASRRFPAWFMGRNPDKQIITSTYAGEFAQDFGREVRGIVASDEYKALFPEVHLAEDSKAKGRWHTTQGGVYVAVGVGGPITGRGAHVALIDDPVKNRQDADSEVYRDTVWKWYTSTLRTRLMPGGAIVLVMTRWHEDDLAGRLLEASKGKGEKWEVISLPALSEDGNALWPEWFPVSELEAIRDTIGPRDWLSLYQQRPTADDGTFFKREWFAERGEAPKKGLQVVITGDFAVTADGGDFTDLIAWGLGHGKVYPLASWYGQTASDVWIDALLDMAEEWQAAWFVGETGPIKRALEPMIKRRMHERGIYVALHWLPHSGADKATNARAFQGMTANGAVIFPETEWAERIIDQLLRFPAGRYDDAVDACGLVGRFANRAWNNPNELAKSRHDPGSDYDVPDDEDDTESWKTA